MKFNKIRFDENGRLLDDCNPLICNGGGKGGAAPQPIFTPPPAAPATEAAAMVDVVTPEDELKKKKQAQTQGAKSLQIPLGDVSPIAASTIGTV
jgi:hypothetical protein